MAQLSSAPAVAVIDQNNVLTLNWQPLPGPDGLFDQYASWDVTTKAGLNSPVTVNVPAPVGYQGTSLSFTETLTFNDYTLTMLAHGQGGATDSNPWRTSGISTTRQFPAALTSSSLAFSSTSLLLGQPLTVTLVAGYTQANQWQVVWPDNTTTGWLPLASNVVTKSFSSPGAVNVTVQTRFNYSGSQFDPPTTLLRQFTQQIFIVDQQAPQASAQGGGLTSDLGVGGQQGFEIVDATSVATTPEPWEIIARAVVRDTVTNELKLLVGTTRFANASSLFGTMAVDVFPISGRPRIKELIAPTYELTAAGAETVPVKIGTTTLPNLIVGKSVVDALGGVFQMSTKGQTGVQPFIWSVTGLPLGVTMNSSGVISGTPLELGLFNVTFAVQDSSVPFSIDEVTLPLLIETDLKVIIAANQVDGNGAALVQNGTTLGVARVGKPYAVLMQVGNINPNIATPGGLPPYTWSTPAGSLPVGLSINPNSGQISGVPCTYNSTTDFNKTFTVTIQVTDAIGAKATQNYTMTLEPAAFQFGPVNQPTIFSAQQFKLAVPLFGGTSPYVFDSFLVSPQDAPFYVTPTQIIDGQVEIDVNMPTTASGVHSFSLQAHDSSNPSIHITQQLSYTVEDEISDVRLIPGFIDHVWGFGDAAAATPLAVSGDLAGFTLQGQKIVLTASATSVGGNTTYTATSAGVSGQPYAVSGFFKANNNGTFICQSATSTTLVLNNPNGTVEPLVLTLSAAGNASAGSTIYTGTITGGASNAFAGRTFQVAGFSTSANNGTFLCTASSGTTITLSNAFGVAETHAATATMALVAKALLATVLQNGITVAIDTVIPDVEFTGPPSAPFRNVEYRVPLALQSGGNTVATISREYTTLVHNNQGSPSDIGAIESHPRPYIVGDFVGLNPRKPFFNSPDLASFNSLWTAVVQNGSSLPPGLSLDANTGLVYGTLAGVAAANSVIEYVDASGTVHGTVTVIWTTVQSAFQLIDNIQDGVLIGTPYPATSKITVPTGLTPVSASILHGVLPAGLVFGTISGQDIKFTGTPSEAGYFDLWFQVSAANSQTAYLYHRFSIDYIKPLTILTTSLPQISAQPYSVTLQGFGGIPPYSWSSPQFPGGAGAGAFLGLSLNSTTGTISGTLTSPPVTSPTDLGNITVTLTDTRGAGSAVSALLDLVYNNNLRILTTSIPTITNDPNGYSFTMEAAGGVPPYQWKLTTPGTTSPGSFSVALPDGVSFDGTNVFGTTGAFSGIWSGTWTGAGTDTQASFNITLKDTVTTLAPQAFTIKVGAATLSIDSSLVGPVPRGESYNGTLQANGPALTLPASWQVAPTAAFPNSLLSGLSVAANSNNQGHTAAITGVYSGVPHVAGTTSIITTVQRTGTLATVSNSLTLSSVASASGSGTPTSPFTTVYTGTITGGGSNAYAGRRFTVSGFSNSANNGTFLCTASSTTTLTLLNPSGVSETASAAAAMVYDLQAGDTAVVANLATSALNGTYAVVGVSPAFPAGPTSFQYNTATSGTITPTSDSGTATGQGYKVRFIVADSAQNTAAAVVAMTTGTNLTISGWDFTSPTGTKSFPLPNAIIGGSYGPIQLVAKNGVPPYTWSSDPAFPFNGIALATSGGSAGQLSGSATLSFDQLFNFTVTDSINNVFTLNSTEFASQASGLSITTTQSQLNANQPVSGRAYSFALAASLGTPPYTFSISPLTASQLPTGLTMNSAGVISGTTTLTGFSQAITFRVTDNIGAHSDKVLTVTVNAGLVLQTGIDFTDNTSTGVLGFVVNGSVDSINPRPNLSFYVIASGTVSTSPSQITVSITNSGISSLVESITNGVAKIKLSGQAFANAPLGTNTLAISVTDSGVTVNGTFTWVVYSNGQLRLAPSSGSIPTQLLTP